MLLQRSGPNTHVTRAWEGQTVACFASGPSLTQQQVDAVRAAGLHAVAVNDCYRVAPWADVVYWADVKWYNWHKDKPEFQAFAGQKCTIGIAGAPLLADKAVYTLKNMGGDGLSVDPAGIMTGSNSGHQAVNLATLSGAARILLLGYDCRSVGGRRHWFGDHPDRSEPPYEIIRQRYRTIVPMMEQLGIEILNCTKDSAIDCFKFVDLEDAIHGKAVSAS
jgi:hypothetical protein